MGRPKAKQSCLGGQAFRFGKDAPAVYGITKKAVRYVEQGVLRLFPRSTAALVAHLVLEPRRRRTLGRLIRLTLMSQSCGHLQGFVDDL